MSTSSVGQFLKDSWPEVLLFLKEYKTGITVGSAAIATLYLFKWCLDTPSRKYDRKSNSVASAYDEWTSDDILEHYWGEHVHLGYYSEEERKRGAFKTSNIGAKETFVHMMYDLLEIPKDSPPSRVLDYGCGIGGSSRILARKIGCGVHITGISISPKQIQRATKLTLECGLEKQIDFQVMDAMNTSFPDNSFDIIWVCESTEHMPDKPKVAKELVRLLKPGGKVVIAVWSQRDDTQSPFSNCEKRRLQFLYDHWTHPPFISVKKFTELLRGTGEVAKMKTTDWTQETLPSWCHQIWMGIVDPLPWVTKVSLIWKTIRDTWCIWRMHQAFKMGLMEYGMIVAEKM